MNERIYIGTTRFNTSTFGENAKWRKDHNWEGCIYGLNKKIPPNIPKNSLIYVLEMNNETNTIEGIGLIRNFTNYEYTVKIYKDVGYNRFIYNSKFRADRSTIKYKKVMLLLDKIVFYGSRHYKRGQGITTINVSSFPSTYDKIFNLFFVKLFNIRS
jgi:hypothetical protein